MADTTSYIIGEINGQQVKLPQVLMTGNYIAYASTIPSSPTDTGVEGIMAFNGSSLFAYTDGLWRKVPVYSSNWDDIQDDTRFLPVNKSITLSDAEVANLMSTLNIVNAQPSKPGLIKGSISTGVKAGIIFTLDAQGKPTGEGFVHAATKTTAGAVKTTDNSTNGQAPIVATKTYVDNAVQGNFSVKAATNTTIGGIISGKGDVNTVNSDGTLIINKAIKGQSALQSNYGVMKFAPQSLVTYDQSGNVISVSQSFDDPTNGDIPFAVTVSQVKGIAEYYKNQPLDKESNKASETQLGFVSIGNNINISSSGSISVPYATESNPGVVTVTTTIADTSTDDVVPTQKAVKDYTDQSIQTALSTQSILPANAERIGGFKPGSNMSVDQTTGVLSIGMATESQPGLAQLASSMDSAGSRVPTTSIVKDYIDSLNVPRVSGSIQFVTITTSNGASYQVPTTDSLTTTLQSYATKQWVADYIGEGGGGGGSGELLQANQIIPYSGTTLQLGDASTATQDIMINGTLRFKSNSGTPNIGLEGIADVCSSAFTGNYVPTVDAVMTYVTEQIAEAGGGGSGTGDWFVYNSTQQLVTITKNAKFNNLVEFGTSGIKLGVNTITGIATTVQSTSQTTVLPTAAAVFSYVNKATASTSIASGSAYLPTGGAIYSYLTGSSSSYKDTSVTENTTSTKVPTSQAVATFVKNYVSEHGGDTPGGGATFENIGSGSSITLVDNKYFRKTSGAQVTITTDSNTNVNTAPITSYLMLDGIDTCAITVSGGSIEWLYGITPSSLGKADQTQTHVLQLQQLGAHFVLGAYLYSYTKQTQ